MSKRKISFVNIYSKNNRELISFYRDVLGLREKEGNKDSWSGFKTGEATLAIEPLSNREVYQFEYNKENPILIQFKAENLDDLENWTKNLENKGVKIHQRIQEKSYGTISTFTDPDGNVIELIFKK